MSLFVRFYLTSHARLRKGFIDPFTCRRRAIAEPDCNNPSGIWHWNNSAAGRRLLPRQSSRNPRAGSPEADSTKVDVISPSLTTKGRFPRFFFHYFPPLLASVLLGGARAALCWMQRKKKFPFSSCLPFVPTLCSTKLGNSWGLAAYRGKFIENTYFSPFSDTYFQKTFYRCQ